MDDSSMHMPAAFILLPYRHREPCTGWLRAGTAHVMRSDLPRADRDPGLLVHAGRCSGTFPLVAIVIPNPARSGAA